MIEHGALRRRDLVGDLPALADVVQHDAEAELLRAGAARSRCRRGGACGGARCACRRAPRPAPPSPRSRAGILLASSPARADLVAILLRLDELLAHQRAGLGARARERPVARIELVPLAIFMPPAMRPSAQRDQEARRSVLARRAASGRSSARCSRWPEPGMTLTVVMPPACARLEAGGAHVERVEHAHVGLDRRRAVAAAAARRCGCACRPGPA